MEVGRPRPTDGSGPGNSPVGNERKIDMGEHHLYQWLGDRVGEATRDLPLFLQACCLSDRDPETWGTAETFVVAQRGLDAQVWHLDPNFRKALGKPDISPSTHFDCPRSASSCIQAWSRQPPTRRVPLGPQRSAGCAQAVAGQPLRLSDLHRVPNPLLLNLVGKDPRLYRSPGLRCRHRHRSSLRPSGCERCRETPANHVLNSDTHASSGSRNYPDLSRPRALTSTPATRHPVAAAPAVGIIPGSG
ncbi:MAG: hypothetical protein QOG05_881 [Streptosporangiaceae bacterium]|nr:hypothetical protein [Streptosporangiaceae bacterium]